MAPTFRWFLASNTAGALADGVAYTALPLLVVGLTTAPFLVALVQVAAGLPWLLFSLPAGVVVDRLDRRSVLWAVDVFRGMFAASLVALVAFRAINLPLLLALAFLEGVAMVFRAASTALLPSLVARADLGRANGQLQAGSVVMGRFVGPAVGAVVYPLSAVAPFVSQCLAMAVSVLCLRRLPARGRLAPGRAASRTIAADIREGVRAVLADRVIRSLAGATFLLAASTGMLQAVLVLHVTHTLGSPASAYGVLFVVYALGSLAGTRIMAPLRQRLGGRACLLLGAAVGAASLFVVGAARDVYAVGAGMAALGAAAMVYNITAVTVRQERVPDALLGRVSSVFNVAGIGAIPIAALVAGGVASVRGTTVALIVAAFTCVAGLMWLVLDLGDVDAASDLADAGGAW